MKSFRYLVGSSPLAFAVLVMSPAAAQELPTAQDDGSGAETSANDIVVTANKRSQSINDVPLTITAASGDTLMQRGISSTADLAKIVPGLTAQPSPFNTPVYTLRGVGFYESTLSASPTVAVYTDEVPLPFSAMTKAAALDLERVEVLKGPQGTLFGSNTTGGAINYVAAKPTDSFEAGINGSFGRFTDIDLQGFVSGPLSDTVRARVTLRVHESGDWQESITRADSLGATRQYQGRILLDWDASDRLRFSLNLNGWVDKSDNQATQRIANQLVSPADPNAAIIDAYPLAPNKARAADWSTDYGALKRDDYFLQGALRADYDITDDVTLTSITAYERYKTKSKSDFDGTALAIANNLTAGHINTFSQELRISGQSPGLNWVIGGNYESDKTYDELGYYFGDQSLSNLGGFYFDFSGNFSRQNISSGAVFGNIEYEIAPQLTVQAGLRYTKTRRTFEGCTVGDAPTSQAFEFLEGVLRDPALPFIPIPAFSCFTFDADFAPIITPLQQKLTEDNLSWRAGVNYKTGNRGLVYATISKGYKSGSFPTTSASSVVQYLPVQQESLTAYEVGFKQPVLDRALQFNGAFFYYDYSDKQLRGRVLDVVFGPLDALVQVPKSRVWGLEGELVSNPTDNLTLSVAATYLNTKIKEFVGYNNAGLLEDYAGSRFPYAPKLQIVSDAQYGFPLSDTLSAYVGTSVTYNSATNGSIGNIDLLRIKAFTLVDARIGVKDPDDKWRFEIWGRNLLDSFYWTNALQTTDGYVRYAAKPATYGISFSTRFK